LLVSNLHCFNIQISRNTISKGSGAGIKLFNVKACAKNMSAQMDLPNNEMEAERVFERCVGNQDRVELLDNYVIETVDGYGIVIDSSTCKLELNQVKKNAFGGLLVTTSLKMPRITHGDKSHYLETETASNKQSLFSSRVDQIRCFSQVTIDQLTAY